MSPRHFVSLVLVLSCMFCPAVVGAQTNTVTLAGVATDDTGGALPGATVTATNTATGLVRTAVTDTAGRYAVLGLPPAVYDVRAELQGFAGGLGDLHIEPGPGAHLGDARTHLAAAHDSDA